jgi:hypothetical protein
VNFIKLNFLKLNPDNFSYIVYRKKYDHEKIEDPDLMSYELPTIGNESYTKYYVSFNPKKDFEEFICNQDTNNFLTVKMIWFYLKEKISNLDTSIYEIIENVINPSVLISVHAYKEGKQVVEVTPYYLKSEKKFGFILNFQFRKLNNQPFNREVQKHSLSLDKNYKVNKDYYSDIYHIVIECIQKYFTNLFPINIQDSILSINKEFYKIGSKALNKKEYIFNNNRIDSSQFKGLKQYGPLQKIESDVLYVFIFEDKYRIFANDLVSSLRGTRHPGTFAGMENMFNLQMTKENIRRIEVLNYNEKSLEKIISEMADFKENNKGKRIIGIFLEEFDGEEIPPEESPYYFLKYHLISKSIPLQVVNLTSHRSQNGLKWSASNIGLQIFSKLGGIPWIVKTNIKDCLILGIGSAHQKTNNGIRKYFAYTVCLDSSGIYKKLAILSNDLNADNYIKNLENNLKQFIERETLNKYTKCVLHVPFKIKKNEIESIKKAISEIKNIEFHVIKINTHNKFFGFSEHNTFVPYESTYIKLANNEYLLWFDGLQYGKEFISTRISDPVHIEFLHLENSIKEPNLDYLQDAMNLSGANWRGFNSKSMPISILYSSIIAKFYRAFENYEDFNPKTLSNDIPWFL